MSKNNQIDSKPKKAVLNLPVIQIAKENEVKTLKHLKNVQLESSDEEDSKKVKNEKFKIESDKKDKEPATKLKSPTKKVEIKQMLSKTITVTKPKLAQLKKQNLEKNAQFEKLVHKLKERVISRKFGYLWLRRVLYSSKSGSKQLLPSQIEYF